MLRIPGRIGSEWVAGINRNQWPDWIGIRTTRDFKAVPAKYRTLIPEYVKDYVSLNQFAA